MTNTIVQITKTAGACSCGEPVTRIENCPLSVRSDGMRFVYPNRNDVWSIFRCQSCGSVIDESWTPLEVQP